MNHDHSQHDGDLSKLFWRSCNSNGLIDFESLAASFLLRKHRAHFFGVLPILLLLAFPLMHFLYTWGLARTAAAMPISPIVNELQLRQQHYSRRAS